MIKWFMFVITVVFLLFVFTGVVKGIMKRKNRYITRVVVRTSRNNRRAILQNEREKS